MSSVCGDMAQLASIFRRLINGERDAYQLTARMDMKARGLLLSILEELSKLEVH